MKQKKRPLDTWERAVKREVPEAIWLIYEAFFRDRKNNKAHPKERRGARARRQMQGRRGVGRC